MGLKIPYLEEARSADRGLTLGRSLVADTSPDKFCIRVFLLKGSPIRPAEKYIVIMNHNGGYFSG